MLLLYQFITTAAVTNGATAAAPSAATTASVALQL
jgi:hypothetical protein